MVRLAKEVPLVRYFKIEVPGTANKLRALIEAGGEAVAGPFDGEEAITLMADLDAGATGTMTIAMIPDLIKPILTAACGRRPQDGCGALRESAADHQFREPSVRPALGQGGHEGGRRHQEGGGPPSLTPLHPETREGLIELARELDPLALRWGK